MPSLPRTGWLTRMRATGDSRRLPEGQRWRGLVASPSARSAPHRVERRAVRRGRWRAHHLGAPQRPDAPAGARSSARATHSWRRSTRTCFRQCRARSGSVRTSRARPDPQRVASQGPFQHRVVVGDAAAVVEQLTDRRAVGVELEIRREMIGDLVVELEFTCLDHRHHLGSDHRLGDARNRELVVDLEVSHSVRAYPWSRSRCRRRSSPMRSIRLPRRSGRSGRSLPGPPAASPQLVGHRFLADGLEDRNRKLRCGWLHRRQAPPSSIRPSRSCRRLAAARSLTLPTWVTSCPRQTRRLRRSREPPSR